MGLGAAMMFPATLSLLTSVFTERRQRAAAIGLWGASAGVGVALGPIAGGWLLERFWWGSIFLFMVPSAALVAVLAAWRVPASRDPRAARLDRWGLVLSAAGMALIVYGIIQAPGWGWASPVTFGVLAAGLVLLGVLVAAERATAHPMIDVRLFRNMRFTAASAAVAISFFALLGFIFLVTQYFQVVHGYSPLSTGVRLLPVAASVAVASAVGTRLAVPAGNKVIVGGGMALVCAADIRTWSIRARSLKRSRSIGPAPQIGRGSCGCQAIILPTDDGREPSSRRAVKQPKTARCRPS
jgi:MFS family permease